ncbi:MAG: hypothetical protein AB1779_07300 [Candidatus Thermoplasmatota archaeon]
MLKRITAWVVSNKIFRRQRTKPGSIALAVLVYHFGLSYRTTRDILEEFEPRSHEATGNGIINLVHSSLAFKREKEELLLLMRQN